MAVTRSFIPSARYLWTTLFLVAALVLIAGLVAPFVDGSRFSARIQETLEQTLGRKVKFEKVHFSLFSGPAFSLENVTIGENPRFGEEPFAFVPTLQARVRLDRLLLGQIRFSSFRLEDPSLNLVKKSDDTWNIVELIGRLSAPRRAPLNLFPVFVVSGGRIDFKFEARKTTLYVLDSDLSVYPERSGKLLIQFSCSPARTDRAGNGFAHVRGTANWYFDRANEKGNQLEADLILDPSNLAELTTLLEGHDIGLHGTVSTTAHLQGALSNLAIRGEMRVVDVHRWDLMPASGEDWRVQYGGEANLLSNQLNLKTFPTPPGKLSPVVLEMGVSNFLKRPNWSIDAHLDKVAVKDVLPLARRMGLNFPESIDMSGSVGGVVRYTEESGLTGNLLMDDMVATLPNARALKADRVTASVAGDRIRFDPLILNTDSGPLQVGGTLAFSDRQTDLSVAAQDYPLEELRNTLEDWVGAPSALQGFKSGLLSGNLTYIHQEGINTGIWSGKLRFLDATISLPSLSVPLDHSEGALDFHDADLEISRLSSQLGNHALHGSYRYSSEAKQHERLRVELASANLGEIQELLSPRSEGQSWLARLGVTRRSAPRWLAERDLEGDLTIDSLTVADNILGSLSSHFIWQGADVAVSSVRLRLPAGAVQGHGTVKIRSSVPQYDFSAKVEGFPWQGGLVGGEGHFLSSGVGTDALRSLQATGTFLANRLTLSTDDYFPTMSGDFSLSLGNGWPDLRLANLQADAEEGQWSGEAASDRDGKLVFDLEHEGRSRHVVSALSAEGLSPMYSLK